MKRIGPTGNGGPFILLIIMGDEMAQAYAKAFYKTAKWLKCRQSYIDSRIMQDGGLCEECHDRPGYIVHHKIRLTESNIQNPEVSLNHENLEYVCKECHDEFEGHGLNKAVKPLCMFDSTGQPISLREVDRREVTD